MRSGSGSKPIVKAAKLQKPTMLPTAGPRTSLVKGKYEAATVAEDGCTLGKPMASCLCLQGGAYAGTGKHIDDLMSGNAPFAVVGRVADEVHKYPTGILDCRGPHGHGWTAILLLALVHDLYLLRRVCKMSRCNANQ